MVKLKRCKEKSLKNIRCKIKTADPSGFCRHHRINKIYDGSYKKSDFPVHNGRGYITSEKASIRKNPKSGKKKFKISTLNLPNEKPGKGGKCRNCGNLDTILIDSSSGGSREGFSIDWEYYCP